MRLALVVVIGLVGCGSGDDPAPTTDAPQPTLASIQAKVFTPKCSNAGCHHIDLAKANVSLANEELSFKTMVNVPPSDPALRSTYPAIVVPGDPARSFLMRKLEGPKSGEGLRMPQGMPPLDAATIDAIRTWIAGLPR